MPGARNLWLCFTACAAFSLGTRGHGTLDAQAPQFVRGDADGSGLLGLEDAIITLDFLFRGPGRMLDCESAADSNDDGMVDVGDPIFLLFYLYAGGALPPEPFFKCGEDPTLDALTCQSFWICASGTFVNSIEMNFLPVPAGTFLMGSPPDERGRADDEFLHEVTLTCPFYMSQTEVTQGQYLEVMGENPSSFNGGKYGTVLTRAVSSAVSSVLWDEAVEFCTRLSMMENRRYRLPYEAEWEYATRAGRPTRFFFGDALDCPDDCKSCTTCGPCPEGTPFLISNCYGNTVHGLALPVGGKNPNPWGFLDLYDHAFEWCKDWYGPYPTDPVVNPTGPLDGSEKVFRGVGEGVLGWKRARTAARFKSPPGPREALGVNFGFRIVLELPTCSYTD